MDGDELVPGVAPVPAAPAAPPAPAAPAAAAAQTTPAAPVAVAPVPAPAPAAKKPKPGGVVVHERAVMVDGKLVPMPPAQQTKVFGVAKAAVKAVVILLLLSVTGCKMCMASAVVKDQVEVTFFTQPQCADCLVAYNDLASGYFRSLPIRWKMHDIGKLGLPDDWTEECTTPAWRVESGRLIVVRPYNKQRVGDAIRMEMQKPVQPTTQAAEGDLEAPVASTMTDPDWDGVRILILGDIDLPVDFLAGPISRLLRSVTSERAQIEVITRIGHPRKFAAIVAASGVALDLSPAQIVILADKVIDVGLFKSIALKRIEGELAAKAAKLQLPIPVEVIFERIHKSTYADVMRSLATVEVTKTVANYTEPKRKLAAGEVEETETEKPERSRIVSFLFWMVSIAAGKLGSGGLRFASEFDKNLNA